MDYIEIIAERVGDDTTFAQIIELVEDAQETKSKTEKFLRSILRIFIHRLSLSYLYLFIFSQAILN